MSSKSTKAVKTSSTNLAVDRRTVVENGNAIVDSIMNFSSSEDKVVKEALAPVLAAWQSMVGNNTLNLVEVVGLGNSLMDMANKSQINMSDTALETLQNGVEMFEGMLKQNSLVVELVDDISERSFDLSEKSLDIVADVKTGDFADLSKSVMLFALIALGITAWATTKE